MNGKNILIIKLSAIGDVIHALPVARAIKESFPAARTTWVVEPPAYDLLTNNPDIDDILVFEKKKFKSCGGLLRHLPALAAALKRGRFDVALDLQGLGKSAAIAWLSGAPLRLGCCDMREGSAWVSRPVCGAHADGHIVERYLDVARSLGCAAQQAVFSVCVTERETRAAAQAARQAGLRDGNPYVVLAPGANWPNKRWPTARFARLGGWLYERGVVPVLIGGGVVDEGLAAEIGGAMEIPPVDLIGRTTLKQLAHVIGGARAFVGGDTGPLHLAAALGRPAIAVMGPTDGNRNGPYGQPENVIEIDAACRHCWKRRCALDRDCLAQIAAEQVIEKLRAYI